MNKIKSIAVALGTQVAVSAAVMAVNATVLTVVSRKINQLMDRGSK